MKRPLQKRSDGLGKESPSDNRSPKELQSIVLNYLHERFGLHHSKFENFGFYMASKGRLYLGPKKLPVGPEIVSVGLLIGRLHQAVKPSTNLLQLFGSQVSKNFVEFQKEQVISYAKGEDVRLIEGQMTNSSPGYVLLKYGKTSLGCGLLQVGVVKNMLPKAKRLELKYL